MSQFPSSCLTSYQHKAGFCTRWQHRKLFPSVQGNSICSGHSNGQPIESYLLSRRNPAITAGDRDRPAWQWTSTCKNILKPELPDLAKTCTTFLFASNSSSMLWATWSICPRKLSLLLSLSLMLIWLMEEGRWRLEPPPALTTRLTWSEIFGSVQEKKEGVRKLITPFCRRSSPRSAVVLSPSNSPGTTSNSIT